MPGEARRSEETLEHRAPMHIPERAPREEPAAPKEIKKYSEWHSPAREEIDHAAQERLVVKEAQNPAQLLEEISTKLSAVTEDLIRVKDDDLRHGLAVERAVLLRMRQLIQGDDGARDLPSSPDHAPDMRMIGGEAWGPSRRADSTMVDFGDETKGTFALDSLPSVPVNTSKNEATAVMRAPLAQRLNIPQEPVPEEAPAPWYVKLNPFRRQKSGPEKGDEKVA